MPFLKGVPENAVKILRDSATDIRKLTDRLLRQADADDKQSVALTLPTEAIFINEFLENLVGRKAIEHTSNHTAFITLRKSEEFSRSFVVAEPSELCAVISNLINNAIESYADEPGMIYVSGDVLNNECVISIKDMGCGIPPDLLSKLGQQEITTGKRTGQGIGLRHAFATVGALGGRIEIESTPGVGTTVRVILPCVSVHQDISTIGLRSEPGSSLNV